MLDDEDVMGVNKLVGFVVDAAADGAGVVVAVILRGVIGLPVFLPLGRGAVSFRGGL